MRHDPWLTEINPDDIEAAMQRKAAREALIVEQAAEITRLRAAINDALTAPFSDPELNSTWHQEPIGPNETPEEAIKRLVSVRAEWAVHKNNCENPVIAATCAALEEKEDSPTMTEGQLREMIRDPRYHWQEGRKMNDDLVERLHNPCNAFLVDEVTMEEAAEEITRLHADLDALQARVAELEGVLLEARDDLTEWIDVAHQHREKYPHIMQDFENDMEIVRRIDAALEGEKEQ